MPSARREQANADDADPAVIALLPVLQSIVRRTVPWWWRRRRCGAHHRPLRLSRRGVSRRQIQACGASFSGDVDHARPCNARQLLSQLSTSDEPSFFPPQSMCFHFMIDTRPFVAVCNVIPDHCSPVTPCRCGAGSVSPLKVTETVVEMRRVLARRIVPMPPLRQSQGSGGASWWKTQLLVGANQRISSAMPAASSSLSSLSSLSLSHSLSLLSLSLSLSLSVHEIRGESSLLSNQNILPPKVDTRL